jgi:hypothetical protein
MQRKEFRRTLLAAAAVLTMSSLAAPAGAQASEFDMPVFYWFKAHPHRAAAHRPRRAAWRETRLEAPRRPACVSLACPGFVILGVGF